jgi:hypothetical protein
LAEWQKEFNPEQKGNVATNYYVFDYQGSMFCEKETKKVQMCVEKYLPGVTDSRGNPKKSFNIYAVGMTTLPEVIKIGMQAPCPAMVTTRDGKSVPAEQGNRYSKVRKILLPGGKGGWMLGDEAVVTNIDIPASKNLGNYKGGNAKDKFANLGPAKFTYLGELQNAARDLNWDKNHMTLFQAFEPGTLVEATEDKAHAGKNIGRSGTVYATYFQTGKVSVEFKGGEKIQFCPRELAVLAEADDFNKGYVVKLDMNKATINRTKAVDESQPKQWLPKNDGPVQFMAPKKNPTETSSNPSRPQQDPAAANTRSTNQTNVAPPKPSQVVVKALYDYSPGDTSELGLAIGEEITVTHKDKSGWWTGTNAAGASGMFPANYVQ